MKHLTRILFLCLILGSGSLLSAQNLNVRLIPANLIQGADIVVRQDTTLIDIMDDNRAVIRTRTVKTILTENGRDHDQIYIWHYGMKKITSLNARLFDASGNVLRKVKMKHFEDQPSRMPGVTDWSYKTWDPGMVPLPYTIEYEVEIELSNLFLIPDWRVQPRSGVSVENASMRVRIPNGVKLNYRWGNFDLDPEEKTEPEHTVLRWQIQNLRAKKRSSFPGTNKLYLPFLSMIPESFVVEGVEGNSTSWNSLGNFFYELNNNRQAIPQSLSDQIRELTDPLESKEEKIEALYRFLQSNTRYVSIQFGIGGFQTFDAEYVYQNGFGDCKALTNYMKAMLADIGIDAYAALIEAGADASPIMTEFASSQFNHVILCVPVQQDTIWLECTSQTSPFNYLGSFTNDRYALLLAPAESKLVRTPRPEAEENLRSTLTTVAVNTAGDAELTTSTLVTGERQEFIRRLAVGYSQSDQEDYLKASIPLKSFSLRDFHLEETEGDSAPAYQVTYDLVSPGLANPMGSRLFLEIGDLFSSPSMIPAARTPNDYMDVDSILIRFPAGSFVESYPEAVHLERGFGTFQYEFIGLEEEKVLIIRTLIFRNLDLASEYRMKYMNFIEEVQKSDRQKVIINTRS